MGDDLLIVSGIGIVSFVYVCVVSIMFFLKKSSRRISSKIFSYFLVLSVIFILLYIVLGIVSFYNIEFSQIFGRFVVFMFTLWETMLISYLFFTFRGEKGNQEFLAKSKKNYILFASAVTLINLILSFVLPFEYKPLESRSSYGFSGILTIYYNALGILAYCVCLYLIVKNRKHVDKLTKILFLVCIIFLVLSYVFEFMMSESLNKIPFIITTIVMFLYLSMESQDALLLDEYNESVKTESEVSQLKSDFIMNMSYELRSPMNAILGFTDSLLLKDTISVGDLKEDTESIIMSSKKLLELINSIIDLSKIDSNNDVINMRDYKLENIIYDISSNINAYVTKDNLLFNISADENCLNNLYGDDHNIAKILNIIIKNAVDHTNYGEVSLNISCVKVDSNNAEFTFLVKNSGHTMSIENFNKSFNDIVKLSNDSNYKIDSNIINLLVAKNLIDKIGASIEFINETGKGTQYIIKIKQKVNDENVIGNIREKIQTIHNSSYQVLDYTGKKVLIVDDKNISMVVLQRLLKGYNVTIDTCLNPKDSIDLIINNNYDLVFIENSMDDMSGEDVINRVNATGNKLPFVVGIVNDRTSLNKDNEYSDILINPIEFKKLNRIVNSAFGGEIK